MQASPALPWTSENGGEILIRGNIGEDTGTLGNRYNFLFENGGNKQFGVFVPGTNPLVYESTEEELLATIDEIYPDTREGEEFGVVAIDEEGIEDGIRLISVSQNTGATPSEPLPIAMSEGAEFQVNLLGDMELTLEELRLSQNLTFDAELNGSPVTLRIDKLEDQQIVLRDVTNETTVADLSLQNGILTVSPYQQGNLYTITGINFQ